MQQTRTIPLPRKRTAAWSVFVAVPLLALAFLSLADPPAPTPTSPSTGAWAAPERVLLHRREDNDAYGKSAYSFRFRSQDEDEHFNEVDLVFNRCGSLHVNAAGGTSNQVVLVDAKQLEDVTEIPTEGWISECFTPEEKEVYVMQIEDRQRRYTVCFRILDTKEDRVLFEWSPFNEVPKGKSGRMGNCGGPHGCH